MFAGINHRTGYLAILLQSDDSLCIIAYNLFQLRQNMTSCFLQLQFILQAAKAMGTASCCSKNERHQYHRQQQSQQHLQQQIAALPMASPVKA